MAEAVAAHRHDIFTEDALAWASLQGRTHRRRLRRLAARHPNRLTRGRYRSPGDRDSRGLAPADQVLALSGPPKGIDPSSAPRT
jgi:hypothetical protein